MRSTGPRGGKRIQMNEPVVHGTLKQARRELMGGYQNICDVCRPVWIRNKVNRDTEAFRKNAQLLHSDDVRDPEDREHLKKLKRAFLIAFLRAADRQGVEDWEAVRELESRLRNYTERYRNAG
ncbi:hypothetical protein SEA_LITTLEFELLA_78 [Gordonia phage LittleFella]|nr:hypothetical protein SEA_LITTLEFELLA_78 [Gordonia phage LittleFella]